MSNCVWSIAAVWKLEAEDLALAEASESRDGWAADVDISLNEGVAVLNATRAQKAEEFEMTEIWSSS